MGQSVRQTKYNQFWADLNPTLEGYSSAIDMLLRTLTDQQLDEILAEIGTNGLPDARDTP